MQHVAISGAIIIARKITYIVTLNILFPTFSRFIVTYISHVIPFIADASGVLPHFLSLSQNITGKRLRYNV
jgi:hypothetical protein